MDLTSRKKILVTDDEVLLRNLISGVLEDLGHQVILAKDGSECLREIQEHKPDLILLDLNMPNVRGETVMAMIRNHEGMRNIPLIVMSGEDSSGTKELAEFGSFLPKPFDVDRLCACVKAHLTFVEHDTVRSLLMGLGERDAGLTRLASAAANARCDVYVTALGGSEVRVLVPEELTRLEMTLLADRRVCERIKVLAEIEGVWKQIWPRPVFSDQKKQLLSVTRPD
jgi:two-component system, cell cycle response regulator DivK